MSVSTTRNKIRQSIKPFRHEQLFATGWRGELTFSQIADEMASLVISRLRRYGVSEQDVHDCFQTGLVKLWEELSQNPDLLADKDHIGAMWIIIGGAQSSWYIRNHRRYTSFSDLTDETDYDFDEYRISGIASANDLWHTTEHWAVWASQVDFRLDITDAMKTIAEEYTDDMKGLIALYILTTSVEPMETIATFGMPKSMIYERIKGVRDRLQRLLKEYKPIQPRTWQERLASGEVEPYLKVIEHYQDKLLALFAHYTLTTETKVNRVARDNNERKMIIYYRKNCLKRMEVAYGQAASF
jgi:hypothetical protein